MKKLTAAFLGSPHYLKLAFPQDLRREIANGASLVPGDISGDCWADHSVELGEAQVIFGTWGLPRLDNAFLGVARNLQAVFYAAGSVRGFADNAAFDKGILISSAWRANAIPVAEFTLGATLMSLKNVWRIQNAVRRDRSFQRPAFLHGAFHTKVGLVSLGAIGTLVAGHLRRFDLELLAYDPMLSEDEIRARGARSASLAEIFAQCMVVSIHTPWLPETEKLIGKDLLDSMQPGATLINTSRGAVIDEAALVAVLRERDDLTALLDVTFPEPPPADSPLFDLPNVFLTPHIAGSVGGEIARMGSWMTREFFRFTGGQPLEHLVSQAMLRSMA